MDNQKLPEEFKRKWVEALRSGKYKQGRGQLKDTQDQYCCLGVACIIVGYTKDQLDKCYIPKDFVLIPDKLRGASYDSSTVKVLSNMNDGQDPNTGKEVPIKSFSEIAYYIEQNL